MHPRESTTAEDASSVQGSLPGPAKLISNAMIAHDLFEQDGGTGGLDVCNDFCN